ncbi:MAG: GCN5 family acetyltransferase [Chloroflexi bacterium]|nr:GCN5 family acetyltransferase [Chloroflexota bacterium]
MDKIGQYPAFTKSGGGYFYDEVLEYRAWIHPELGGEDIYDGDDYYQAFATYEEARDFSRKTMGAEEPVVLVVQYEWIDEPEPGTYIVMKKERLTEWLVEWLEGNKRGVNSISDFIDERTAKDTQ